MRDGVSLTIGRGTRKPTEIHWRPGDPNALAQAIINNVGDEEMTLDLDSHTYVVRKVT
jgi:hypothetical protein